MVFLRARKAVGKYDVIAICTGFRIRVCYYANPDPGPYFLHLDPGWGGPKKPHKIQINNYIIKV